jgi:hypothetical protein
LIYPFSYVRFFTSHGWKWENKNGLAMIAALNEVYHSILIVFALVGPVFQRPPLTASLTPVDGPAGIRHGYD